MSDLIKDKLALLPMNPGCYLMKDIKGQVIYVGKAKKLKNRVKSYFMGSHNGKTARLVREIVDFEYIITSSELEALVLEINLIKKYDPKYNIMLTDDKHYPYIKLTNETHPRLVTTRKIKKDGGKYFGPYPNSRAANETIRLLNKLYPLRKCHPLARKFCLYYHIHQCLGPCENEVDLNVYKPYIDEITKFLKGDYSAVKKELSSKMLSASENLEFEKAKEYRDLITHIEATVEKQKMTLNDFVDRDVFGYAKIEDLICVQVFFVRQGKVIERDVSIFDGIDDTEEAVLTFIGRFYQGNNIKPKEIFIPSSLDEGLLSNLLDIKVVVPKIGEKKQLVELAMKNAQVSLEEKLQLIEKQEERTIKAVEALGDLLYIPLPHRIEAFDNSHLSGVDLVSGMVVFTDGKPDKKEYRKYKITSTTEGDDYQAMKEVIYRRYFRVLNENLPAPDLIIIDGGKGQVNIAKEVLDTLNMKIPVIGLIKDDKHRTNAILDGRDMEIISLKKSTNVFQLLTRIQDEVHRFVIGFHQHTHQKRNLTSILDEIGGVGPKRKQQLLQNFGTLERMLEASDQEYKTLGFPEDIIARVKSFIRTELKK
ncbi:MAG: excinuclease ABC subunit UvrC [Turicibacter sp.]